MRKLLKRENGITLIALIITIVVMLILVVVSIQIALETGLFESAGKATKNWELAQEQEGELGNGKVNVGGTVYNSIEEYTNSIKTEENEEVDFEKLFATAEKHPDQIETNDIGIAEDGSIVNMDLWIYEKDGEDGWALDGVAYVGYSSYDKTKIVDGKIIGQVPMYIRKEGADEFCPVISMYETFYDCDTLVIAPEIPSTVTDIRGIFLDCTSLTESPVIPDTVEQMRFAFMRCESLTEAPAIPNSVTSLDRTFLGCTSLTEAPVIPNSVTDVRWAFQDCTSLTEAPVIPSSVTDMRGTFSGCAALNGTIVINASNINSIGDGSTNDPYIFNEITNNLTVKVPANSTTYESFNEVYGTSENITIETF